eukprot:CAMPEP_0184694566 /NCGR_PEP_ID=MMETSP0313-20130426/2465_1 /TAXON_ID=2792 /ORGANISM="Porphyridium aerugineum, Strain SAG 1380-2" /LENGTH=696 /DNA_ID=CAMNT_0027152863 /DNA_START=446 /DNA_END=2536 /DNA_ORIENTATION=-
MGDRPADYDYGYGGPPPRSSGGGYYEDDYYRDGRGGGGGADRPPRDAPYDDRGDYNYGYDDDRFGDASAAGARKDTAGNANDYGGIEINSGGAGGGGSSTNLSSGDVGAGGPQRSKSGLPGGYQAQANSSFGSKFKDKMRTMSANAKKDMWKTTIIKATRRDNNPPKQKHVSMIMEGLRTGSGNITDRGTSAGSICHHLRKRLLERDWIVAVKALSVFHFILREAVDVNLVKQLASTYRNIFDMSGFQNELPDGVQYVGFVHSYGKYLIKWCELKSQLDYPPTKVGVWETKSEAEFSEQFKKTDPKTLVKAIPMVLGVLNTMYAMELKGPIRSSPVGSAAITLILRDFEHYWLSVQQGFLVVIDEFYLRPDSVAPRASKDAAALYTQYQSFTQEAVKAAKAFSELGCTIKPNWVAPAMQQPSDEAVIDIMYAMYDHAFPDAMGQVAPVVDSDSIMGAGAGRGYRGAIGGGGKRGVYKPGSVNTSLPAKNPFYDPDADPFAPNAVGDSDSDEDGSRPGLIKQSSGPIVEEPDDAFGRVNEGFDSLLLAPPSAVSGGARGAGGPGLRKAVSDVSAWQGSDPFNDPAAASGSQYNMNRGYAGGMGGMMSNPMMLQQQQAMAMRQQQMQQQQQQQQMYLRQQQMLQQQRLMQQQQLAQQQQQAQQRMMTPQQQQQMMMMMQARQQQMPYNNMQGRPGGYQ